MLKNQINRGSGDAKQSICLKKIFMRDHVSKLFKENKHPVAWVVKAFKEEGFFSGWACTNHKDRHEDMLDAHAFSGALQDLKYRNVPLFLFLEHQYHYGALGHCTLIQSVKKKIIKVYGCMACCIKIIVLQSRFIKVCKEKRYFCLLVFL